MKVIIGGRPGSGKGTQAKKAAARFDLRHVSAGDLLRSDELLTTEFGRRMRALVDAGEFVPDSLILDLVCNAMTLTQDGIGKNGVILDGFPRTRVQAAALCEREIKIDAVIFLDVPVDLIVMRMEGRRYHLPSGRSYHVKFCQPRVEGRDDVTGDLLVTRPDDQAQRVKERLQRYDELTQPVLEDYRAQALQTPGAPLFLTVDGAQEIDDISREINAFLDSIIAR